MKPVPVLAFTRSAADSPQCSPHADALSRLPQRLVDRLLRLDAEQLQIVEVVAAAIVRGAQS
jgi:hypothetical protein